MAVCLESTFNKNANIYRCHAFRKPFLSIYVQKIKKKSLRIVANKTYINSNIIMFIIIFLQLPSLELHVPSSSVFYLHLYY